MVQFRLTRRVLIQSPPETVWPWIAQMGRGAGWYSFDWIDNGGRASARHIVSWVPPPGFGDASAIGSIDRLDPGHLLSWNLPESRRMGVHLTHRMTATVEAHGDGTRLTVEMEARFAGPLGWLAATLYRVGDMIMARRQLRGIRIRVERFGARPEDPKRRETGDRTQFQWMGTRYGDGTTCGRFLMPGERSPFRVS